MKKIWKQNTILLLVLVMILGIMTGCGGGAPVEPEDDGEESIIEYLPKLYFVSADYLETGDETIEPMVIVETEVAVAQEQLDEVHRIILEALAQVPAEEYDTMVREGMVTGVTVSDGLAVVDFDGSQMNGGSMEEVYLIEQVVRTLVRSFDNIQKVRFTVDGSEVDSLMGHLEARCTYGMITVQEDGKDVELVTILED